MRRAILLLLALLLAAPVAAQRPEISDEVRSYLHTEAPLVVLRGVKVIDGTGAPARLDQTVVVAGDRIAAVGPRGEVAIPEGAEVLDVEGHTVLPGLIGMHNHTFYTTAQRRVQLNFSAPLLYLGSGVTTVRTTGSYAPYSELNLKRAIARGEQAGPRLFVTGPYITGGEGMTYMTRVRGAESARRVVRYWAEEGVDWFKAYTLITREELDAAIEEAHKHGIKVTGHLCSVSFREAVALGIDNLEHGFFTNTDYDTDRAPDTCPSDFRASLLDVDLNSVHVQQTFRDMIEAGVGMTSTLAVYELIVPGRPPLEDRVLEAMSPEVREDYLATRERIAQQGGDFWARLFAKAQAYEKAFVEAGGLLAAGVDPTGIGGALPGYGDQRNFELLVEAGFTPVEVVQIMSANGARILGIADDVGTVEAGKRADLVVLSGDPEADPAEIRTVRYVFKDGLGFDAEKLIAAVQGQVGIR